MTTILTAVCRVFFCLSLLFVAISSPAIAQTSLDEARRHLNRGMAAVEMVKDPADYDLAIEEFQKAQALAPDWADVYYNLGLIQEKAGKFREAVVTLRKYLQLAPGSPEAAEVRTLADKAEFKAEQVLSDEDIVDIFASLADSSRWQVKGDTSQGAYTLQKLQSVRKDGSGLLVPSHSVCSYGIKTQSVKPKGKFLEFHAFDCICERSTQEDECLKVIRYNLEILSRRSVKMNVRVFFPEVRGYNTANEFTYSFGFVRR